LATYTDFYKLGDANNVSMISSIDPLSSNATYIFEHCTFDSCGVCPNGLVAGGSTGSSYQDVHAVFCKWTNPLATHAAIWNATASVLGSGIRLIDSCVFLGRLGFNGANNFTITNNYIQDGIECLGGGSAWAACDGNFITRTTDDPTEIGHCGDTTNNYLYYECQITQYGPLLSSYQGDAVPINTYISGNVCEYGGGGTTFSFFGETEETSAPDKNFIFENNIVICNLEH
jgi:hypothetical protein